MDGATNHFSGASTTETAGDRQTSPALIETVSRALFSSDYYRKVTKTTDIAGRLPNAVYTLPMKSLSPPPPSCPCPWTTSPHTRG